MADKIGKEVYDWLKWSWEQGRGFDPKHHSYEYEIEQIRDRTNLLLATIKEKLEKEFGHAPSQRILAMMNSKKWNNFWEGVKDVTGKRD